MSKRRLDEKKLREIQMRNGNRGPGGRFGGLKEKPKDIKKTLKQLMKYIGYSKWFNNCSCIIYCLYIND